MTNRPIGAYLFSLVFFLFLVQTSFAQVTISASKWNKTFENAKSLFESGDFELAKLEIDDLFQLPGLNGILSEKETEFLTYMKLVCGLNQGSATSVSEATDFVKTTPSKQFSTGLAFYLSDYFFKSSNFDESIVFLEKTDPLYLNNDQNEQVQFQKGVAYFSQKRFDIAVPYLKSLYQLENSSYHDDVTYYLGFIAFAQKNTEEALKLFQEIKESTKYKNIVPFYLAFLYNDKGDRRSAILYGEDYLKSGDKIHQNEMLNLLGSLYFNSNDFQKSAQVYEQINSKGTVLSSIQKFELGTSYFQLRNYEKAIKQLSPLSSLKDSIGLHSMFVLAQSYLQVSQKSNARSSFGYCISGKIEEPKREIALFYYAKLSFELGFEDQGMNGLSSFILSYPSSKFLSEANEIMFAYYAKTNNFKKAILQLQNNNALKISNPSVKARVYFGRGMELINELDYAQADKMMADALLQKDKVFFGPALFWRGELAFRTEKYDTAISFFTDFLNSKSAPLGEANEPNALYSIGYAYFEKEEYKNAQPFFEKIQSIKGPDNLDIKNESLILLADCMFMQNNIANAKSLYNTVYQKGNDGADYALYQLSLIEGINSPEGKIKLLKEAERKYPKSEYTTLIFMEIADTYLAEEQYESAIPYLKKIPLLVNKDDEMIPDVLLKMGIAYYNLDQADYAIEKFSELISNYPSTYQSAEALESAKSLYIEKGKLDDYENFLKSSGKTLTGIQKDSLRYQVVQTAIASSNFVLARQSMNQYLNDFPDGLFAVEVLHLLAEVYVNDKDWINAAKTFELLSERGASRYQEKALRQASKIYFFELKDYEKAAVLFQQLSTTSSKSEIILEALRGEVRARYFLKNWISGIRAAEQLLAHEKVNQDDVSFAACILGYFAQENKEYQKSNSSFLKAVNGNQSALAAESRYQVAFNTVEMGDLNEAEKLATSAIEASGSNEFWITKSYILLGKVFMLQKDFFNAKATLKSVIDNCTIPELREEAQKFLNTVEENEKQAVKQ